MFMILVLIMMLLHFMICLFNKKEWYSIKCLDLLRPKIIKVNSNKPLFYPSSIEVNKCSGSSNYINDPYAKLYVSDVVKKINAKVFNLISRTNETRQII